MLVISVYSKINCTRSIMFANVLATLAGSVTMHFASIELWRITLLYTVVLASLQIINNESAPD
jgi:type IV secretory pathway VirB3-like protein